MLDSIIKTSIIIIILILLWKSCEGFADISVEKPPAMNFEDDLFRDLIYYDNSIDRLGLDKCVEDCKGSCLEFGITGNAWCFPKTKSYMPVVEDVRIGGDNVIIPKRGLREQTQTDDKLQFVNLR